MSKGHISYSRVKGKTRYWEPSRKLRALGFKPKKWPEGPEAREKAKTLTARAEAAIETRKATDAYVSGSLKHFWMHYIARKEDAVQEGEIKPRTVEEYRTAWLKIEPKFGHVLISDITPDDVTEFYRELGRETTPKVRHRAISKLKALLDDAVVRQIITVNPAAKQRNPAPKPRTATFLKSEIQTLIDTALEMNMISMSLTIRLMYETARAPVDARLLNLAALCRDPDGPYIDRSREKTGVEGYQPVSEQLYADIMEYVEGLGVQLHPDAPIFRQHKPKRGKRVCAPWTDESDWSKDFAKVRRAALGQDTRKAMDIRRTANLEAVLGEAKPEDRAALLANSLDRDKSLDRVYTPQTLIAARKANAARAAGRDMLASAKGQTKNGLTEKLPSATEKRRKN